MNYLEPLIQGSKIGIISPSEPIVGKRIDKLKLGIEILNSLGFKVVLGENVFKQNYYMAGTVEERAHDFNKFIKDEEISMIMTSWGGKSSNQLLEFLDYESLKEQPKLICGFSDPTSFLNAIYKKTGIPTLYGPDVVGKLDEDPNEDLLRFKKIVTNTDDLIYNSEKLRDSKVIKEGIAHGVLIGGNLSSFITGVLGTEYQPSLDNSIFFFESGSPKPRDLHQMLTYLKHFGFFKKLSGMIVLHMDGSDSREWANKDMLNIIEEELKEYTFPILYLPALGHGNCPKTPLPIGVKATLNTNTLSLNLNNSIFANGENDE